MMKPIYKVLGLGILVVALVGAMWLAKSNQNIQRGATYASAEVLFLPDTKTMRVGEELMVNLSVDAKVHKLSGIDLVVLVPNIFEIKEVQPIVGNGTNVLFRSEGDLLVKTIDQTAGKVTLSGISMEMDEAKMATGVVGIVKIKLQAKAEGTGEVGLDSGYDNMLTGYNPNSGDQELAIGVVKKGVYTVRSQTQITPTRKPTNNPMVTPTRGPRPTVRPTNRPVVTITPGYGGGQTIWVTPTKKQTGCIVKPACVDAGTCPSLAALARRGLIKFCK